MSARLALRLAAFETLCPYALRSSGTPAPWPTLAGPNVYDTRADPIEAADDWAAFLDNIEGQPIIILYTEDDETTPSSGEYPPDREVVGLVVEILIAAKGIVNVVNAQGAPQAVGSLAAAITDWQREALLDLLEAQVRAALDPQGYQAPAVYLAVAMELHHVRSVPQRDVSKTVRLAARTLRLTLRVKMNAPAAPLSAGAAPLTGLAVLPQPLQAVAGLLPAGSPASLALANIFAPLVASPSNLTALSGLNLYLNVNRGATPAATSFDVQGFADTSTAGAPAAQGLAAWLVAQAQAIGAYLRQFWPTRSKP